MRRAFSLIEVVIATVILSVVGLAMLQMGSKNHSIDGYIEKKSAVAPLASLIAFHHDSRFDKLEKTLYDFVKSDYVIDNDEIKAMLENQKVAYSETKVATIDFGENNVSEEATQTQHFEIVRSTLRLDEASIHLYFLRYR